MDPMGYSFHVVMDWRTAKKRGIFASSRSAGFFSLTLGSLEACWDPDPQSTDDNEGIAWHAIYPASGVV